MKIEPLGIPGSYSVSTVVHRDERGEFTEWFRADHVFAGTGLSFVPVQANLSVSAKGTLRGIHFADVPPGQAKYVICVSGSIVDYVVDIRVGSPTFGKWESVTLSSTERNAIILDVGLGHAFVALEPDTVVSYLVTDVFKPHAEHGINPHDAQIGLEFPFSSEELLISPRDLSAPSLADLVGSGSLPRWKV